MSVATGSLAFDSSVATHAFTVGGLTNTGGVNLADNAGSPNPVALSVGSAATASYAGVLSGPGSVIKVGAGTQTMGGANTYAGNTTITAGVLNLGVGETPGTSGPMGNVATNAVGTHLMTGGSLQYSAANQVDYSGRLSTAGSQAWTVVTNNQSISWATALQGTGS